MAHTEEASSPQVPLSSDSASPLTLEEPRLPTAVGLLIRSPRASVVHGPRPGNWACPKSNQLK